MMRYHALSRPIITIANKQFSDSHDVQFFIYRWYDHNHSHDQQKVESPNQQPNRAEVLQSYYRPRKSPAVNQIASITLCMFLLILGVGLGGSEVTEGEKQVGHGDQAMGAAMVGSNHR